MHHLFAANAPASAAALNCRVAHRRGLTDLLAAFSVTFLGPPKVAEGHKAPAGQPPPGPFHARESTLLGHHVVAFATLPAGFILPSAPTKTPHHWL
jgi:hypothetical protein